MNVMIGKVIVGQNSPMQGKIAMWLGFAAMCLGMFMAILDIQVVATSLPSIKEALGIPAERMSWIQTAYLIAEIIAIPITGPLTRLLGLRKLFLYAVLAFTAASAGCATSSNFTTLVTWRTVQGFSGGTLIPAVFSAVFMLFPEREQGRATTLAGITAVLAPTVGPIVGGWITDTYSWKWLFLINVAPGIVALIVGFLLPSGGRIARRIAVIDGWVLVLLAISLASLELALKNAPESGWTSTIVLGQLSVSAVSGVGFTIRTWRSASPMLSLRTFKDRNFAIGCAFSFVLGIGLFGSVYLMPVFLGLVRHLTALEIGVIMLATGLAQLLTAPIAVALERRVDARLLTAFGFGLFGLGLGLSAFQTPQTDGADMLLSQILRGSSVMFCILPPTRLALAQLAPERIPDASGLFNLMRNLGGAIGIALIDTVVYGRVSVHADQLIASLRSGDADAARFIGIPVEFPLNGLGGLFDGPARALLEPLLEAAAMTQAINEAWALVSGMTIIAILLVPLVERGRSALGPETSQLALHS